MKKHRHRQHGWHDPNWEQWQRHEWSSKWKGRRGFIFVWFMMMFGTLAVLILGGIGAAIFLFSRLAANREPTAVFVWLAGCGLALALPLLAMAIARRAFTGIAAPLAEVMDAANQVAEGDLSVRVSARGRDNQFSRLSNSFNHMVTELERSDQQRRNLTADVAHELRTPLHIIQGNLEGILDGVYEPTTDHIEATLEESRLLARLVDDLHTLSQAEAGQLTLQKTTVDVTEILADVQTSFSGQAEAQQIALNLDFDGKAADFMVQVDPMRLDQVVSNLVANALRHTEAGGAVVLQAERKNGLVLLRVADDGEGISPADLPFIFDRFWRGDRARTHADGAGGGLGLAIAKQLVEAHDGRLSVVSELDEGTTFTIQLPLSETFESA